MLEREVLFNNKPLYGPWVHCRTNAKSCLWLLKIAFHVNMILVTKKKGGNMRVYQTPLISTLKSELHQPALNASFIIDYSACGPDHIILEINDGKFTGCMNGPAEVGHSFSFACEGSNKIFQVTFISVVCTTAPGCSGQSCTVGVEFNGDTPPSECKVVCG